MRSLPHFGLLVRYWTQTNSIGRDKNFFLDQYIGLFLYGGECIGHEWSKGKERAEACDREIWVWFPAPALAVISALVVMTLCHWSWPGPCARDKKYQRFNVCLYTPHAVLITPQPLCKEQPVPMGMGTEGDSSTPGFCCTLRGSLSPALKVKTKLFYDGRKKWWLTDHPTHVWVIDVALNMKNKI